MGRPRLLPRALANLIANAIQYADQAPTILLAAETREGAIFLTVNKAGPAIEPARLFRLFDRFDRPDAARRGSAPSSGLGLSIVRTILALYDGGAHAQSSGRRNPLTPVFSAKP